MFDIKNATEKLIKGCIIPASNGVNMYTPDGQGNYDALWTRDFFYMVDDASEMIPLGDIKNAIQYLIDNVREDGWVPDRVSRYGTPYYTAGGDDFPASPNLDNGPFLCLVAVEYLKMIDEDAALEQFLLWKKTLCAGLDCLPVDGNGMMANFATPPHSPYGFTDTICKTGLLCFETLLLWKAKKAIIPWLELAGEDAGRYKADVASIEENFEKVFLMDNGTLRAGTAHCNQTDVWAMCYALSVDFPLTEKVRDGIIDWLAGNYDSITEAGQLRHIPAGEYWEKTLVPVEKGTYQNGAFWATPVRWFCDALREREPELVTRTLKDVLDYFEKNGIFECVNGDYKKLDTYVASATAVYASCKKDAEIKAVLNL